MPDTAKPPITVFFSYCHKDERLRDKLHTMLVPLEHSGLIRMWHDRAMTPGDRLDEVINDKLSTSDIILIIATPDYFPSFYCYQRELKQAIAREQRSEARVIPVIMRPCKWDATELKDLLALPTDGKAVTRWSNRDSAYHNIMEGIEKAAKEMQAARQAEPPATPAAPAHETGATAAITELSTAAHHAPTQAVAPAPLLQPNADGIYILRGRSAAELPDLAVFKDVDAPWCPEMVVIPAGEFLMGSPKDEEGRWDTEGPQHRVDVTYRFALGRYAVTFAEYDHFCEETGRRKLSDNGWGRKRRPVIDVDWEDAKAYCAWLSEVSRRPYRLPSEAEWEYACRAGTRTRFAFGDTLTEKSANVAEAVGKTTEVGAYPANPWGLSDMHGNVWEWVEDCWHESYEGAPEDGSAWLDSDGGDCGLRVLRGGSWFFNQDFARSANRNWSFPRLRGFSIGFRVVCSSPSSES